MGPTLVFRPLAAHISKKTLLAFRRDAGWPPGEGEQPGGAAQGAGRVQWVTVETGTKVIGIARLELAPPQFCHVSDLIIASGHRGNGVGEWFMKHIEAYCAQLGIPRVLLQPVEGAHGFYRKMRFVADPHVVGYLKKELNPFQRKMLPF